MAATDATPLGRRDAALVALGYVFALRRSELVALDLETQGTGGGVLRITAKTMEIAFAISKTSTGEPQTVAVPRAENAEAVKAVEAWLATADIQRGEPILRRVTKGGAIGGRLHPQSVSKIIKARVIYRRHGAPESKAKAGRSRALLRSQLARWVFSIGSGRRGRRSRHRLCNPAPVPGHAGALRSEGRPDQNLAASVARRRA